MADVGGSGVLSKSRMSYGEARLQTDKSDANDIPEVVETDNVLNNRDIKKGQLAGSLASIN